MNALRIVAAAIAFAALAPAAALAQAAPPAPAGATATLKVTAQIVAIDYDNRIVTLEDAQGNTQVIKVGPDVTRFANLKVGDKVTFTYQESIAYEITKPGAATPAPGVSQPTVMRNPGDKPGGTISQTTTALVTITAIDAANSSLTVKSHDGHVVTMLVKDKALLAGLNVGDTVQITYSQELGISVE